MTDQYVDVNTNAQPNPYREIVTRTRAEHRLLTVHWELTYRCNERCTHCYLDVLPPSSRLPAELSTIEAKGLVDELAELGALTISFSGGEVFLRKDIFEISRYARNKGFAVRYFTNGTLIRPEVADNIAAVKPVVVELSLYAADAETHDQITQVSGSFFLTLRAIRLLLERQVRCIIKTPLMKENVLQFSALKELAADLGISFQYDLTIVPKHTGDKAPLRHRPTDDQLLGFLRERVSPDSWRLYPQSEDFRFCGIGMNSLNIGPYGDISTCVGARIIAGNIRHASLKEIWLDSPVWKHSSSMNLANLTACSTCELRQFCLRCHGNAAFEDGDILGCSSAAYREARLRRQAYEEHRHDHVEFGHS